MLAVSPLLYLGLAAVLLAERLAPPTERNKRSVAALFRTDSLGFCSTRR